MGPTDHGLRRRHHHDLPTMRLPLGTAITVRFGDITDAAKKVWVAAHLGEPVAGVTLRGVVCGHSGAWHRVTFAKDHPEIEREVSLKAAALVPPAPAAAPAEHRRVGPTTVDLEEWFPLGAMSRAVDAMNQRRHTEKGGGGGGSVVPFSLAEFKVFLAVLLAMALHSTVSLEELWDNPAVPSIKALPTRYGFAALMTQRRFNEWRAYFRLCMLVAAHLQVDGWAKIGPTNPPTINTNRVLDM
eukprot:jgi/Tetstr1/455565/TSEL_042384.t1